MEKNDLNGVRTPQDVIRRFDLKNIKVLMDDVEGITTEVSKKVGNDEIISRINQSAEQITIDASKISLEGYTTINDGFSVDLKGNMSCNNATINGSAIVNGSNFTVDEEGNMSCNNAIMNDVTVSGGDISLVSEGDTNSVVKISDYSNSSCYWLQNARKIRWYGVGTGYIEMGNYNTSSAYILVSDNSGESSSNTSSITPFSITTPVVNQTSQASKKKNFEPLKNGLEIIKDTDIYTYNLKTEKDDRKKHIGFVIGDGFNYRQEMTDVDNQNVELYSFISVCCKAIQEQQEQIEELKKEIDKLKRVKK